MRSAAQLDRDYIREKPIEGQRSAAEHGHYGCRRTVIGENPLVFARALRGEGVRTPKTAKKIAVKWGKNGSAHPSGASLYRALADDYTLAAK